MPAIRTLFCSFPDWLSHNIPYWSVSWRLLVKDKYDAVIKGMCSTDIKFLRSKLLQSYSNFTLKPKLEPTVVACLAGRDAHKVFILDFSKH